MFRSLGFRVITKAGSAVRILVSSSVGHITDFWPLIVSLMLGRDWEDQMNM